MRCEAVRFRSSVIASRSALMGWFVALRQRSRLENDWSRPTERGVFLLEIFLQIFAKANRHHPEHLMEIAAEEILNFLC